jgi:hypothetical protein
MIMYWFGGVCEHWSYARNASLLRRAPSDSYWPSAKVRMRSAAWICPSDSSRPAAEASMDRMRCAISTSLRGAASCIASETSLLVIGSPHRWLSSNRAAWMFPSLACAIRLLQTSHNSRSRSTPFFAARSAITVKKSGLRGRPGPPGLPFVNLPPCPLPLVKFCNECIFEFIIAPLCALGLSRPV